MYFVNAQSMQLLPADACFCSITVRKWHAFATADTVSAPTLLRAAARAAAKLLELIERGARSDSTARLTAPFKHFYMRSASGGGTSFWSTAC